MCHRPAHIPIDAASFSVRANRTRYLAAHFGRFLGGSVLDVGCDMGLLRDMLPPGSSYTGVDIGGNPDIRLNLEEIEALPFGDEAFDVVACTDVLEHLDNLHFIFSELVRVSGRYLIISLPNNWTAARRPIARGSGQIGHYGLPLHPPADRHKWFFNLSEAKAFLEGQAELLSLSIVEMHITEKPRPPVVRGLLRLFAGSCERYLNRYAHTLWAVLENPQKG